ncbi:MAG: 50S ribosomal protein L15 [Spirochaetes bacterium]|nr:50S ribosomal protein L15 [Spirochaetota bacterium]
MNAQYSLKRPGSHRSRKRVGCGIGSGSGKTSGRGQKGQKSRSGSKHYAWFEGGQMPLQRRVPKRGFNNKAYGNKYQEINLSSINALEAKEITPEEMKAQGLIANPKEPVKVLSRGDLTRGVKITADAFTKPAIEKIKNAGGEVVIRTYPERKSKKKS